MKTNEKRVMSLGRIFTLKNVVFCTIGMICFALVSYHSESQKLDEVSQVGFEVYLEITHFKTSTTLDPRLSVF